MNHRKGRTEMKIKRRRRTCSDLKTEGGIVKGPKEGDQFNNNRQGIIMMMSRKCLP